MMKKIRNKKRLIILMRISTEKITKNIMKSIENYISLTSFILIILLHLKNTFFKKKRTIAFCSDRRQVRKAFQNNFTPFNLKKYFADN